LPGRVAKLSRGIVAIAAGATHTCALMRGGHVFCTGQNGHGQLGDGTKKGRRTSVAVVGFGAAVCTVPAVLGKTLAPAIAAIARSNCRVGTVRRVGAAGSGETCLRSTLA